MPLEVQGHAVPHLKGLMCCKLEARGLRCGIISILCHTLLKNAILLHIEATVRIFFGPTVLLEIMDLYVDSRVLKESYKFWVRLDYTGSKKDPDSCLYM